MTRLCYLLLPLLCWLLPTTVASQRRPAAARPTPFVLGVVEELYSAQLAENRKLNIYLPEGYQSGDSTRYPVIYLLDGSADEDFIHVVGLESIKKRRKVANSARKNPLQVTARLSRRFLVKGCFMPVKQPIPAQGVMPIAKAEAVKST